MQAHIITLSASIIVFFSFQGEVICNLSLDERYCMMMLLPFQIKRSNDLSSNMA